MLRLTTLLPRLGTAGALANVQAALEARRREDRIVEALARRLGPDPAAVPAPPAVRPAAALRSAA